MLVADRTHRQRADRAWLPPSVRNVGRFVTGTAFVGAGAAVVGAIAVVPAALLLWKVMLLGGAGVAVAGDRAGRALLHRQLARLGRGEVELADLRLREEGELVVVRGTIEADASLRGLILDAAGVYRRLVFSARGKWVHEAVVDFVLIDDAGQRIFIRGAGARWLVPDRERVTYPAERFTGDGIPARVRELAAGRKAVDASEQVLGAGEAVQIVGYKTTSPGRQRRRGRLSVCTAAGDPALWAGSSARHHATGRSSVAVTHHRAR